MGNYISCTLPNAISSSSSSGGSHSIVILPNLEIRNIGKAAAATSAAELMLEFPGHFLVSSRSLRVGRGFHAALSADEDLEPAGNVYVMFPMQRLNSLVNAADTAQPLSAVAAAAAGKGTVRQRRRTSTVTPVVVAVTSGADAEEASTTELMISRRSSLCRSRRPALEPIAEEET